MDIHPQGIHVGQPLLRLPVSLGTQRSANPAPDYWMGPAPLVGMPADAVPVAAVFRGLPKGLGRQVGVNI
jgi:hypothetical protein